MVPDPAIPAGISPGPVLAHNSIASGVACPASWARSWRRLGKILNNLGTAYSGLGQPDLAAACWKDAAKAMNEAGEHQHAALLEQQAART
jgi:hypothetical protein